MSSNKSVEQRLEFIEMDSQSRQRLKDAREILSKSIPIGLDRFYAQVRKAPEVRRFFTDEKHIDAAKSAQFKHWMNIASGEFDSTYLASVERIGHLGNVKM